MTLHGRRALVTGAGQGLGREIALRLRRAGAEVIVTDRDASLIDGNGYQLDVTAPDQVRAAYQQIHLTHGPIDLLVNNAGVVYGGPFLEVEAEQHRRTVAVNLLGLVDVTQVFLPDVIAHPRGQIVNIASASAFVPLPRAAVYAATKAAVVSFGESLREELRHLGYGHVGVTTVCPSFIATGLFAGAKPARGTWMLSPARVAAAVVRAIERRTSFVVLPWTARWLYILAKPLPASVYRWLCRRLGVADSMVGWKGHSNVDQPGR